MVLSNDIAALIGFACEATLWGAYAMLFIFSTILLFRRKKRGDINRAIVIANCLLFASCTVHYALEFNHFYTTLWAIGVDGYANETKQLVGADTFISVCDLFGDIILLYRCWVLWGRNYWVIVLPCLTAISGLSCIAEIIRLVVTQTPTAAAPNPAYVPLLLAGYTLPLCTNVMTSGLIVFRIWWMSRYNGADVILHSATRTARGAMAIIVESGLLYLLAQLVLVVLLAIEHPAEGIAGVIAVQIYGIAPTLIIIRVGLGIAWESTGTVYGQATPMAWAVARGKDDPSNSQHHVQMRRLGASSYGTGGSTKVTDGESLETKAMESTLHVANPV